MAEYDASQANSKTKEQILKEQKEEQKKLAQLIPKALDGNIHGVRFKIV